MFSLSGFAIDSAQQATALTQNRAKINAASSFVVFLIHIAMYN